MKLDELWARYRDACPDVEPGTSFTPGIWARIEARASFWSVFEHLGSKLTAASALLCLLVLAVNLLLPPRQMTAANYTDALMADHTAETTDYTEALSGPLAANHR